MLVLEFEEFKNNKGLYISKMEDFLQVQKKNETNSEDTFVVNKSYSNRRMRALKFLNKFRKSEINPFPILSLSNKLVIVLSKFLSFMFSNNPLVKQELIERYLSKNNYIPKTLSNNRKL